MRLQPTIMRTAVDELAAAHADVMRASTTKLHWYSLPGRLQGIGTTLASAANHASTAAQQLDALQAPALAQRSRVLADQLQAGARAAREGQRTLGDLPAWGTLRSGIAGVRTELRAQVANAAPAEVRDWLVAQAATVHDDATAGAVFDKLDDLRATLPDPAATLGEATEGLPGADADGLQALAAGDRSLAALRALVGASAVPRDAAAVAGDISTAVEDGIRTPGGLSRAGLLRLDQLLTSPEAAGVVRDRPALRAISASIDELVRTQAHASVVPPKLVQHVDTLLRVDRRAAQLAASPELRAHVIAAVPAAVRATDRQTTVDLAALGTLPAEQRPDWSDDLVLRAITRDAHEAATGVSWPVAVDHADNARGGVAAAIALQTPEAVSALLRSTVRDIRRSGGVQFASVDSLQKLRALVAAPRAYRQPGTPALHPVFTDMAIANARASVKSGYPLPLAPQYARPFDALDAWSIASDTKTVGQAAARADQLLGGSYATRGVGDHLELQALLNLGGPAGMRNLPPQLPSRLVGKHDFLLAPGIGGWGNEHVLRAQVAAHLDPDLTTHVLDDVQRFAAGGRLSKKSAAQVLGRARAVDIAALDPAQRLSVANMRQALGMRVGDERAWDTTETAIADGAFADVPRAEVGDRLHDVDARLAELDVAATVDQSMGGSQLARTALGGVHAAATDVAAGLEAVRATITREVPELAGLAGGATDRAGSIAWRAADMHDVLVRGGTVRELEVADRNPVRAEIGRLRAEVRTLDAAWSMVGDAAAAAPDAI